MEPAGTIATPIAAPPPAELGDGWATISALARARGVTRQAMWARIERMGIETRAGAAGKRYVCVAAFDAAVQALGDPAKEQAAATKAAARIAENSPATAAGPVSGGVGGDAHALGETGGGAVSEARRKQGFEADLKEIELRERLGRLVPIEDVERAMVTCGEAIVRIAERAPQRAAEMVAAVDRDRENGARAALKAFARDLRIEIAEAMKLAAAGGEAKQEEGDE